MQPDDKNPTEMQRILMRRDLLLNAPPNVQKIAIDRLFEREILNKIPQGKYPKDPEQLKRLRQYFGSYVLGQKYTEPVPRIDMSPQSILAGAVPQAQRMAREVAGPLKAFGALIAGNLGQSLTNTASLGANLPPFFGRAKIQQAAQNVQQGLRQKVFTPAEQRLEQQHQLATKLGSMVGTFAPGMAASALAPEAEATSLAGKIGQRLVQGGTQALGLSNDPTKFLKSAAMLAAMNPVLEKGYGLLAKGASKLSSRGQQLLLKGLQSQTMKDLATKADALVAKAAPAAPEPPPVGQSLGDAVAAAKAARKAAKPKPKPKAPIAKPKPEPTKQEAWKEEIGHIKEYLEAPIAKPTRQEAWKERIARRIKEYEAAVKRPLTPAEKGLITKGWSVPLMLSRRQLLEQQAKMLAKESKK